MRKPWLALPLLILSALPVWADGGPEQAAGAGEAVPTRARLKQQLRARGAEVRQLEQQLTEQESHSHQAHQRLAEQDLAISRLRRQLEVIGGRRQGSGPGH
ncbi:hypothetical protein [Frateuria sp. STR12]|uniref:hypothetical protein n=1 Tax=Frateuria hangzhouensis TaxID=2995589 RepID=UPI002260D88E|nr:hypothetical protein [Frateuria sp. STR12]MCX7514830.1 hypothetical protein [Frateuria sp. STR12]